MPIRSVLKFVTALLLLLCGCASERELESGLDSKQSIEMMVILSRAGIDADRENISTGREQLFRVVVPGRQYTRAIELLHEYRLPERRQESLEQFLQPKGFVPDMPKLMQLRLDHALALQLERLLTALPGVVDATAVVNSGGANDGGVPGASIVVRYSSPSSNIPFTLEEVRQIATKLLPGLPPDSITVKPVRVVLPAGDAFFGSAADSGDGRVVPLTQLRPFFVFRIPEEDLSKARNQLLFYTLAFCFAGGLLGAIFTSAVLRRRGKPRRPGEERKSFFIEAAVGNAEAKGVESKSSGRLLPGKGALRGKAQGER